MIATHSFGLLPALHPIYPVLQHPDFGSQSIPYQLTTVSDHADTQVMQVISLMGRYASEDASKPEIMRDAREAISQLSSHANPEDAVSQDFYYVKRRIGFVQDERLSRPFEPHLWLPVVEVLIRPAQMSTLCVGGACRRLGDCDDFAMYLAAILLAQGFRDVHFCTLAADSVDPSRYSHVYVVVYVNGKRIALDPSQGAEPGWEAENKYGKREEWPVRGWGLASWVLLAIFLGSLGVFRHIRRWIF